MSKQTSETNALTARIKAYLFQTYGAFAWRQNDVGVYDSAIGRHRASSKKGVADILSCVPVTISGVRVGVLVGVEIKVGKDRLHDEQIGFKASVDYCGGKVFIAHDFDGFVKEFEDWYSTIAR